jgi:hypothetical protein
MGPARTQKVRVRLGGWKLVMVELVRVRCGVGLAPGRWIGFSGEGMERDVRKSMLTRLPESYF